ncbi:hypothetical protein CPC08DRAFT_759555 [Agrocybe pediades]|nr:hypothetical protein CPC08DRAFT_759555 [Agrocybe pediades]
MSSSKRRKLDNEEQFGNISQALLSEISSEIDVEIAMKQQIVDTFESRIAWAMMLKESLLKNGNGSASHATFKNVALDALSAAEESSDHILFRDPGAPPLMNPEKVPRAPRKVQTFGYKAKPSFLFLRSNPLVNPEGNSQYHLYLLKCPGCARTTFTSLQGLLNHARLTHGLEWGTHDECIRACAVVDNDLDVDAGIEVAVGPAGILPGLRTIFQNAVAGANLMETVNQLESDAPATPREHSKKSSGGNHLIQTLGLHEDSPALAPFLGKEAIRREIRMFDEECDIDLAATGNTQSKLHWKMPFAPRNFLETTTTAPDTRRDEDNEELTGPMDVDSQYKVEQPLPAAGQQVVSNESRFHFIARIIITDRSLWVPLEQRPTGEPEYTHKWMVSVEAPSYAHNITTVLNSVEVVSSDPNVPIHSPPAKSSPPFAVVGYAKQPFLARVELSFTGTSQGLPEQKVSFMHWVDLDPLGTREVVMGQEQFLDVELDKHTLLKPLQVGYPPIHLKSLWNQVAAPKATVQQIAQESDRLDGILGIPERNTIKLQQIIKQYPMFVNNSTKSTRFQGSDPPYRPVPSAAQFKTLTMGRRKAIEWSRAMAIRDAYLEDVRNSQEGFVELSVPDVYYWMVEKGHFYRENKAEKPVSVKREIIEVKDENMEQTTNFLQEPSLQQSWCPICGLDFTVHATTKFVKDEDLGESEKPKLSATSTHPKISILAPEDVCHVVPRVLQIAKLPRINVRQLLMNKDPPPRPTQVLRNSTAAILQEQSLVSIVDPSMILWIRRLTADLGLSRFERQLKAADDQVSSPTFPMSQFEDVADVEKQLSPFAMLALFTKQFATRLVRDGLEVANRDNVIASGLISSATPIRGTRKRKEKATSPLRLLTPTHILSGMLARGRGRTSAQDNLDIVILSSLSKLGIGIESESSEPTSSSRQGESIGVKVEQ